jgi:DNA replication and repair protein RecF
MVAPDDVELITGGSEIRRKFLDTLLCQLDGDYLQQLIVHNKVLQQRNSYLKKCAQKQTRNNALLDVYDQQLTEAGRYIFSKREAFLPSFQELVVKLYTLIAGKSEPVSLHYESQLSNHSFIDLLMQAREKDYMLQRSTVGIHKDNLDIQLNGESFKSVASQGQRKSLLFSLKLAEAESLKTHTGFAPLLLLDDVFEKLDAERMHNLLRYVCIEHQCQVFLSDTHPERIQEIFGQLKLEVQVIKL